MGRGGVKLLAAIALVAIGCVSTEPPTNDRCQFGTDQQALSSRCLPRSLDPVTDPANPDFGRVPCVMVEYAQLGSDFCDCTAAGYRPATQNEAELALTMLSSWGACENACCQTLCFCELMQLSGDQLRACQGGENAAIAIDTPGFCYVEPDVGVGDPSTVAGCQPNRRELLILTPLGSTHQAVVSCETTLE